MSLSKKCIFWPSFLCLCTNFEQSSNLPKLNHVRCLRAGGEQISIIPEFPIFYDTSPKSLKSMFENDVCKQPRNACWDKINKSHP